MDVLYISFKNKQTFALLFPFLYNERLPWSSTSFCQNLHHSFLHPCSSFMDISTNMHACYASLPIFSFEKKFLMNLFYYEMNEKFANLEVEFT